MSLQAVASLLAGLLLAGVSCFHIALATGAPLGGYAWGGEHKGILPQRLRIGSAVSAVLTLAMAAIVLIAGGVLLPALSGAMEWAVWAVFFFMVLNTVANWRSRSDGERRVMTPITALLALLLLVVQFG